MAKHTSKTKGPQSFERHPLSALFSRCDLGPEDLATLAEDIKDQGQLLPITIFEGMILDGWNRYQACLLAKVQPFTMPLAHGTDPWEFVKGVNMFRRHMSPAERVAVMLLKAQMVERPKSDTPSVREIAKDLEVGRGTANLAQKIVKAQDPALNEALADKKVSLEQAAELAKLPEPERKAALEHPEALTPRPKAPKPGECPSCQALREQLDELISSQQAGNEEFQAMVRICDADDRLVQSMAEVKRLSEMNRVLTERLNGKMAECHALTQDAKRWMRKAEKFEKQLKALDQDGTFEKVVNG